MNQYTDPHRTAEMQHWFRRPEPVMATVRERQVFANGNFGTLATRTYEVLTPALASWLLDDYWRNRP